METYKVKYNQEEDETSEVFCIALVNDPANESMFITMSTDKKELIKLTETKEKRQITGVVLIPNQKIYRFNEKLKKEFNLVFGEEEIRKLSIDFFKNGYQKNSNINHLEKTEIEGLTFFESWIVEDSNNDKARALGFDVPKGTWMATAYVEDDKAWEMAKSGELKGFSIEAFLDTEKIEMSINNNNELNKNEKMSLLKRLITMFSADENIQLASIESDLGPLTADAFEVGQVVYKEDMSILADASFVYEGNTYSTDAEGKILDIVAIEEAPVEDVAMEDVPAEDAPVDEAPIEDVIAEEVIADVAEVVADAPVEEVIDWEEVIKNITKNLDEVIKENTALKAEVALLGKQPSATKLGMNTNSTAKESYWETLARITKN